MSFRDLFKRKDKPAPPQRPAKTIGEEGVKNAAQQVVSLLNEYSIVVRDESTLGILQKLADGTNIGVIPVARTKHPLETPLEYTALSKVGESDVLGVPFTDINPQALAAMQEPLATIREYTKGFLAHRALMTLISRP
jgi:hypothetical protein